MSLVDFLEVLSAMPWWIQAPVWITLGVCLVGLWAVADLLIGKWMDWVDEEQNSPR